MKGVGHLTKERSVRMQHDNGTASSSSAAHGHHHSQRIPNKPHLAPVKSDIDFQSAVEKGKNIKDRIHKLFQEKFDEEKMAEQADYAKQMLDAVTPMTRRKQTMSSFSSSSLQDGDLFPNLSDAITNEDSFVEKRAKIGIFPVSEVRVFPQRRPQTSWEVGLRQYDPSNDLYNKPLRRTKTDTKDNDDRLEVHTPVDSPSRPASAKMLHQHSFAEIKRLQYASPTKLVALTDDVKDRYFGDVAIEKYHETYRELVDHGKLMLGGYDELHEITKQEEPTVLNYAMDSLLADGVLTPRDEQLSRHSPKYKMKPQKGIRDMQVDLTIDINRRTGRTISDDSAQQVRFKTGELAIESKPSIDERETQDSVSPLRPSRKSIGSSLSKLRLNDDPDSVLNDYSYEDRGGQPTYGLSSPRAIFLSGCLKYNLPPRTQVMVRKQISSTINLAHMGIGNTCAVVLAEAVPFIPHLQVLNLCDNALEDSGLSAIIRAIAKHKTIEILDISQNTIDEDAADALADFIGTPDCYLQCLRMSNANIDDGECARFVDVLMHNCHLKELDMSNNLLGKDENLNAVQPDFVTGGESLAELIRIGSCPIQTLNLHWNMIRLEGAEVLCDSIRSNIHLTDLDLSYNALGSAAACVLGAALMENRTIQKLNLANNGIDAVGCFTLFVGLRENASLHDLVIDGNPIGEQGARIMMKIAAEYGHRLQISAKTCDFKAKSSQTKFLIENPCGEYVLDMSHPYDRAIAFEMFDIATKDTSLDINSIEITESNPGPLAKSRPASPSGDGASSKLKPKATAAAQDGLKVLKFEEKKLSLTPADVSELESLKSIAILKKKTIEDIVKLAAEQDRKGDDFFSLVGLKRILMILNVHPLDKVLEEIRLTLDSIESGHIDVHEFVEHMVEKIKIAQKRVKQMKHTPRCAVVPKFSDGDTSKLKRFIPPTTGFMRMKLVEGYNVSDEEQVQAYPLTDSQSHLVIKAAEHSSNPTQLVLFAVDSYRLHLEEAQFLFKFIAQKADDPTIELARILIRMYSSTEAMRMIKSFIGNDILKHRRLKQRLGSAYNPIVGIYSGYYNLDLSSDIDRICLKKLIEKSVRNVDDRRRRGQWDTSQNGNWSCFRNEYHHHYQKQAMSAAVAGTTIVDPNEERTISPKFFYPIPQFGKVEFDFVNIERPDPHVCRATHEDRVIDCLLLSRLLPEDQIEWAINRLNEMSIGLRRHFLPDGSTYYKIEIGRAKMVSEHLYNAYSGISQRRQARKKAIKREAIKSAPVEKTKKKAAESKGGKLPANFYSSAASMRKVASTAALGASGTNSAENSRPGTSSGLVKRPRTASSDQSDSEKEKEKEKTGPISEGNMLALAPHLVKLMKETITKFRTLVKRGKADKVLRQWGKRLYEVVLESTGSDEYKSAALLEFFESELGHLWLYCKYVALVLELFADFGTAPRSNFGSYRVELLVMLFDRIIDLHNFEIIISVLTAEEQAAVHARIGILNFFNPCKPEGSWSFDLTRWEERQVVMILVHLSIVEPGDNWVEGTVSFHFDRGFPKTPGWGLTTTWLDNELPNKGMLSFEFFAGGGTRLTSCCVDMKLRHKLASLCLAGQRDYELEIRRREMLYEEKTVAFKLGDVMPHNTYPELYRPGAARPILAHLKLLTQYPIIASISEHTQRTNLDVTLQEVHQLAIEQQEKEVQDEGANALISYGDSDLVIKPYTVEDCNKHLIDETDIKWNYSDANNAKYESWLPKH